MRVRNQIVASLIALMLLVGCDSRSTTSVAQAKLRVFATVYATGDFARQVGGKFVEIDFAVESGQSLKDLQVTDALRQRMNACQIIIACGTIDQWAVGDATNAYATQRVLRLDALSQAGDVEQSGFLWLDPVLAQRSCDELARRFTTLRPEHGLYFTTQANHLKESLDAIIAQHREKFAKAKQKRVMALSYDFDPLANRFGVEIEHVPTSLTDRFDDDVVRRLTRTAREQKLGTLIIRADTPPALIDDLAKRTGLRIVTLDAYGSSAATGRDTYTSLLQYDLDQLFRAIGND